MPSTPPFLDRLRSRLVVSCQADEGSPLRAVGHIVALARAAAKGGAVGLRIEGVENIAAVRQHVDLPIIGIVKTRLADGSIQITSTVQEVRAVAAAGAEIIAFDATHRDRKDSVAALCAAVHTCACVAMADVSVADEAREAMAAGSDFVGTTLAGYTEQSSPRTGPDFALMGELAEAGIPFAAEGRIWTPEEAQRSIQAGAQFVVVGSAITRPDEITRRFSTAVAALEQPSART